MPKPAVVITDKVISMLKSMVVLAMRVSYKQGATTQEISVFLRDWAPSETAVHRGGMLEHALRELQRDGQITMAGARWYPVAAAA